MLKYVNKIINLLIINRGEGSGVFNMFIVVKLTMDYGCDSPVPLETDPSSFLITGGSWMGREDGGAVCSKKKKNHINNKQCD